MKLLILMRDWRRFCFVLFFGRTLRCGIYSFCMASNTSIADLYTGALSSFDVRGVWGHPGISTGFLLICRQSCCNSNRNTYETWEHHQLWRTYDHCFPLCFRSESIYQANGVRSDAGPGL